jgi:hypothetical protein
MNGDSVAEISWKKGAADPSSKAAVLRSLGKLARGLSTLFWSLPLVLVVYVQSARTDWLQSFHGWAILPAVAASAMLWRSLAQLRQFQNQERIWRQSVDSAEIFSLINIGLSPFLFWWHNLPFVPLYVACVAMLALSSVLLLMQLNRLLDRLAAMLPDETLRTETKFFASFNTSLLLALLAAVALYFGLEQMYSLPRWVDVALDFLTDHGPWIVLFVVLIPLAMTMALVWKIKELIFSNVFNAEH